MTTDHWKKLIRHVQEKVEDHYWSCDGIYRQYIQRFIVQLVDDSDSDTSSNNADSTLTLMMGALQMGSSAVITMTVLIAVKIRHVVLFSFRFV